MVRRDAVKGLCDDTHACPRKGPRGSEVPALSPRIAGDMRAPDSTRWRGAGQQNTDTSGCALRQWSAHYRRNPPWLSTTAASATNTIAATPAATARGAVLLGGPTTQGATPGVSVPGTGSAPMALAGLPAAVSVSRLVIVRAVRARATVVVLVAVSVSLLVIASVSRLVTVRAVRARATVEVLGI